MPKPLQKYANAYNGLHKGLKPEDVSSSVVYAISINPKDQPLQTNLGKMKLNCVFNWLQLVKRDLNRLSHCRLSLSMEMSQASRLHFHGTLIINDNEIIDFYYHDLPLLKAHGSYEMDTIKDTEIWLTYCNKQYRIMKKWCKKHDIDVKLDINYPKIKMKLRQSILEELNN